MTTTATATAPKAPAAPPAASTSKPSAPKPAAVGNGAPNHVADVKRVQDLINKSIGKLFHFRPFKVTGHYDLVTNHAITAFQRSILLMPHPTGQIHPDDQTDKALQMV